MSDHLNKQLRGLATHDIAVNSVGLYMSHPFSMTHTVWKIRTLNQNYSTRVAFYTILLMKQQYLTLVLSRVLWVKSPIISWTMEQCWVV